MSNSPLNATNSQPQSQSSSSFSPPPDLAALAEKFQEATQALLALCEKTQPTENEAASAVSSAPGMPESKTGGFETVGEMGSYYFSPSTLRRERELLQKYHAKDFCDLLDQAHVNLVGLVKLMKSVHADVRVRGYVISSLGCLLEQASALLLRMRNLYTNVRLAESRVERDTFQS